MVVGQFTRRIRFAGGSALSGPRRSVLRGIMRLVFASGCWLSAQLFWTAGSLVFPTSGVAVPSDPLNLRSPPAVESSYYLEPRGHGGYSYQGGRIGADIDPDGRVVFRVRERIRTESFRIGPLEIERPGMSGGAGSLRSGRADPAVSVPGATPPIRDVRRNVSADSRRSRGGAHPSRGPIFVAARARVDLIDEFVRWGSGHSPDRYDQARFLAATFELRMVMAAEHRALRLREAAGELPKRLAGVWVAEGYTKRERRRILFLLWSEIDQGSEDGRAAAEAIESWVRDHLRVNSGDGFSSEELVELNRSIESERPFVPYGSP